MAGNRRNVMPENPLDRKTLREVNSNKLQSLVLQLVVNGASPTCMLRSCVMRQAEKRFSQLRQSRKRIATHRFEIATSQAESL